MRKTQGEILALSFRELFSKSMLKLAFLPFIIIMVLFYALFFYFMSDVSFSGGTGLASVDYLLEISAVAWILTAFAYIFGIFALYWVGIFFAVILAGFFTPYIIAHLQRKHYSHIDIAGGYGTITNSLLFLLKTTLVMLFWFLVLVPLYFIPVVNVVAINLPFYYFFHKMLHFDVASNMLSKERHIVIKHRHGTSFRFYSLFLYLLSMIPFVVLVLPVFYILYLAINYFEYVVVSKDHNPHQPHQIS